MRQRDDDTEGGVDYKDGAVDGEILLVDGERAEDERGHVHQQNGDQPCTVCTVVYGRDQFISLPQPHGVMITGTKYSYAGIISIYPSFVLCSVELSLACWYCVLLVPMVHSCCLSGDYGDRREKENGHGCSPQHRLAVVEPAAKKKGIWNFVQSA